MKRPVRIDGNIAYVPLSCGQEAIIDAEDAEKVSAYNWRDNGRGYAVTDVRFSNGQRTSLKLHRLIMNPPNDMQIDHIHGEKLDNRKAQLRLATNSQNQQNQGVRENSSSGLKGVSWRSHTKKWLSRIGINNKQIHLGYFTTPELAHQAYCKASAELHKEFGRTT